MPLISGHDHNEWVRPVAGNMYRSLWSLAGHIDGMYDQFAS